ncbi:hypothetical protein EI427_21140 [Flammeovirga pectinis]|uniref:Uncharacterized protein n=1 Tax=Flammeovirga pectinis TaxID=2494373 RepID=A0A3S9P9H7_9BACT|nr:hypothetical protein [Flammeovirga pectinis]AZQ64732.1 hypothetical protein EI427_21140 [Flammeovirga pectinis]
MEKIKYIMIKALLLLFFFGFIGQTIAQNSKDMINDMYKVNLNNIYHYINNNNLAVCAKNYKFIGVYRETNENVFSTFVISIFSGNYDIINERKILKSKIYYIAGLTECSDKEFNDTSSTTTKFYIDLGNNLKVKYYNFNGSVCYNNRNLIHTQATDILNPKHMNAMYKSIDVVYDNIYFPEAYGLDYNYEYNKDLNFTELAKRSIESLYKDFHKIETEYKEL